MMITRKDIDINKPLTEEQKTMLRALESRPEQPDEDFPELTPEQLSQFERVSEKRREERSKQTVSIRLSPKALRIAKSLGRGYTSVLSRILESALSDTELIKRFL